MNRRSCVLRREGGGFLVSRPSSPSHRPRLPIPSSPSFSLYVRVGATYTYTVWGLSGGPASLSEEMSDIEQDLKKQGYGRP